MPAAPDYPSAPDLVAPKRALLSVSDKTGLVDFARALTIDGGVTTIPLSVFYGSDGPTHFVRFAFCKKQSTIDAALTRLASAKAPT